MDILTQLIGNVNDVILTYILIAEFNLQMQQNSD